ncbi:hypothetical protein Tco_1011729, partial [Tanacetum coccineum]
SWDLRYLLDFALDVAVTSITANSLTAYSVTNGMLRIRALLKIANSNTSQVANSTMLEELRIQLTKGIANLVSFKKKPKMYSPCVCLLRKPTKYKVLDAKNVDLVPL